MRCSDGILGINWVLVRCGWPAVDGAALFEEDCEPGEYVCTHVCTYVYVCTYMYVCTVYVCMYTYVLYVRVRNDMYKRT